MDNEDGIALTDEAYDWHPYLTAHNLYTAYLGNPNNHYIRGRVKLWRMQLAEKRGARHVLPVMRARAA